MAIDVKTVKQIISSSTLSPVEQKINNIGKEAAKLVKEELPVVNLERTPAHDAIDWSKLPDVDLGEFMAGMPVSNRIESSIRDTMAQVFKRI